MEWIAYMTMPRVSGEVWRTIAAACLASFFTGFTGWLLFGVDSVKHAQIDSIMATRAPYLHDKQRIWDTFTNNKNDHDEIKDRIRKLEELVRQLSIEVARFRKTRCQRVELPQ